ncbi:hypothetical protein GBE85_21020 [Salmonella enterica]|uniref:Uncharacterized protein n=4 Tax=Salmonella enterica TaxID=28901 RepID=A0A3Z9BTY6_SALTM|nr:hypothetical protein [Salmonella enterica subsp. enterica serovar Typhimurium]EAA9280716.1 hypothetical protein [Salmonella enterica]EAC2062976.1 hypothetical protein [Salmonella enterica subsp. enterica serovar Typhimurium var. 5-]EAY3298630.1 hypothetical protein [Salmonella enterica subsp. enterica serovar Dublin]EBL5387375.1 hypothetical protein [Salmonella enterica subsp. enterica serovar Kentucky]EBN3467953.1 hypothetical protein [Salmonella enterica subsp. enterica serovar Schwarzeng
MPRGSRRMACTTCQTLPQSPGRP